VENGDAQAGEKKRAGGKKVSKKKELKEDKSARGKKVT